MALDRRAGAPPAKSRVTPNKTAADTQHRRETEAAKGSPLILVCGKDAVHLREILQIKTSQGADLPDAADDRLSGDQPSSDSPSIRALEP